MKILKMCNPGTDLGGDYKLDALKNLTMFGISSGSKYPLYDTQKFRKDAEQYSKPQYRFKELRIREIKTGYCVEPVWKITEKGRYPDKNNQYDSHKFSLVAGIKVHDGDKVVWKKGLEQDVTINAPKDNKKPLLDFELSRYMFNLLKDISKNIELKN